MNRKKVLSVVLASAMCLTMASAAFAETPSIGDPVTPSIGDPTTPSIGDPVLPENTETVAPNAGRTPSVGDIQIYLGVDLNNDPIPVGEDTAHVEVYGHGAQMTPAAKALLDAQSAAYPTTLATFELVLVSDTTGEPVNGQLTGPTTVYLSRAFGSTINFADPTVQYTLLHYMESANAVEALPVGKDGSVVMTSLSPCRLVATRISTQPEGKPDAQPEAKPEVRPAPVAPTAPVSPKTADRSVAALGLLAVISGAGVALTHKRK